MRMVEQSTNISSHVAFTQILIDLIVKVNAKIV